jgi:lipoyl(octanoyl) transferase
MLAVHAGSVVYEEALRWQGLLAAARSDDAIDDVLLSLEHDPVYTAGRHANVGQHVLGTTGIRVVRIDRGGDVTYHGPGQLTVYPIMKLADGKRARGYVEALEQACIATAASYGISARSDRRRTGVWVGERKLAAIGVRVARRVTSHGLGFNVTTTLEHFAGIVPCGIRDAGVCSLRSLGVDATVDQVRHRLVAELGRTLGRRLQFVTPADLGLTTGLATVEGGGNVGHQR